MAAIGEPPLIGFPPSENPNHVICIPVPERVFAAPIRPRTVVRVKENVEQVFVTGHRDWYRADSGTHVRPRGPSVEEQMTDTTLTGKRREILEFIESSLRDRGYPP